MQHEASRKKQGYESMKVAALVKSGLTLLACSLVLTVYAISFGNLGSVSPFVANYSARTGLADWVIIYAAGRMFSADKRDGIYNIPAQMDWCNKVISPAVVYRPLLLQYPPWFLTLMSPFSLFDIKQAYVIWSLLWPVLGLFSLWLNVRINLKNWLDQILFLSMAMVSFPALLTVKLGQTSFLYLTCIALAVYGWRTNKERLAGIVLALGSFKIQYTLLWAIPVLTRRKWRLLLWGVIAETALIAITIWRLGWSCFPEYPKFLASIEASGAAGISPGSMVNIVGIAHHFLSPQLSIQIGITVLLAAVVLLAVMWWQSRSIPDEDRDAWPIAATLAVSLVTSLHCHYHDCILLALAAAITLRSMSFKTHAVDSSTTYGVWNLILVNYPITTWICYLYKAQTPFPILGLVNLVLAIVALVHWWQLIKKYKNQTKEPAITS
ncbi:MAG: DUF2029 domain-containing protein [Candidatus Obscuribacterales bacterium]|nr:DUF2029 domain-containing protein [Candidatus Obscuribacterales bacterium]